MIIIFKEFTFFFFFQIHVMNINEVIIWSLMQSPYAQLEICIYPAWFYRVITNDCFALRITSKPPYKPY